MGREQWTNVDYDGKGDDDKFKCACSSYCYYLHFGVIECCAPRRAEIRECALAPVCVRVCVYTR